MMAIDRRTFVAGIGAGVAGLAIGAARAGQPDPLRERRIGSGDRRRIRLSLKFGMIGEGETLAEKFAIVRDAGFDGVELDSPNDFDVDEVLKAKEETGIEVPGVVDSVHWNKPLSHPDPRVRAEGRHALEEALVDCKAYGGTTVLLVPGIVNADVSYQDAWDRSIEEIRRSVPMAQELGIAIAIENVWNNFLLSPLEAVRYLDEIARVDAASPNRPATVEIYGGWKPIVGWYMDLGNIVNYGWPEQWVRTLGNQHLLKADVKDYSRKKRNDEGLWKGFDVEIGEGDVDWGAVRQAFADVQYEGWASAEVGGGDRARLADIARRMDRVINGADG